MEAPEEMEVEGEMAGRVEMAAMEPIASAVKEGPVTGGGVVTTAGEETGAMGGRVATEEMEAIVETSMSSIPADMTSGKFPL